MSMAPTTAPEALSLRLTFEGGTLLIEGLPEGNSLGLPGVQFDPRAGMHRAEAIYYREIILGLRQKKIHYRDEARAYEPQTPWPFRVVKQAFPGPQMTTREWKRQQMGIVGSEVPIVRCLMQQPVLNLSFGGRIYPSSMLWEQNFLDVAKAEDFRPR